MEPSPPGGRAHGDPSALRGLAAGLVAGLAGSLAMATFQALASKATGSPLRPAEHDVAGDAARPNATPSTIRGAQALARWTVGAEIPAPIERPAGWVFHCAFGTGLGGLYGLLAEYAPFVTLGVGVPFGALQVVAADEWSVPALDLSADPQGAPVAGHLRALGGHLVYGVATEMARRAIRRRL